MKKKGNLILLICILILSITLFGFYYSKNKTEISGKLIYRRYSTTKIYDTNDLYRIPYKYQYFLIDFSKNHIQDLGYLKGNPSISRDGKYLAVSCNDDIMKICLINLNDFDNSYNNQFFIRTILLTDKEVDVPQICEDTISNERGLHTISWSNEGDKLAILCGMNDWYDNENLEIHRHICIIDIYSNEYQCWIENDVETIDWSPISNKLLLSINNNDNGQIFSLNLDTMEKELVTQGKNAIWFPNGKKFIYNQNNNDIHIYDIEKNKITTIIDQTIKNEDGFLLNYISDFSVSPDENYVAFRAEINLSMNPDIVLLNIKEKSFFCLSCYNQEYKYNINPTWGK